MDIEVENFAGSHEDDTGLDALASKLNIALLEAVREGEYGTRAHKKMVVRRVFPTILAARKNKLTFDEIAEILNANEFDIKASTLRVYFFELMGEESDKTAIQHSNKVVQMRKFLDTQNARDVATKSFDAVFGESKSTAKHTQIKKAISPVPPVALAPKLENSVVGNKTEREVPTTRTGPKASSPKPQHSDVMPASLAEVAQRSMASEDHSAITQDIVVKEGFVFFADGTPFDGTLNKKHLFLLNTNGRIIAESKGRTSDKAVKIRDDV